MDAGSDKSVTLKSDAAWLVVCLAVAAALRLPSLLRHDLWFDEIWSLRLAQAAPGVGEIVYAVPTSNNHILMTLWLYAARASSCVALLRLPSFVAGLAAVWAAMAVARRWGEAECRAAGALCALWYPLLTYSTEARGYALAAAAALACWAWLREPRRAWAFAVVCSVGLLSQLIFLYVYAALVAAEFVAGRSASERLKRHALPALVLAAVCIPQLLRLTVDGPPYRLRTVLEEAAGLLWATPATAAGAAAAVLLSGLAAWPVARELVLNDDWAFIVPLFALPLAAALTRPPVLFSRYFLPAAACAIPVFASGIVRWWRGGPDPGRGGRAAAAAVLAAVFCSLQIAASSRFWKYGRGGYGEAVDFIASSGGTARVASDHDFRNGMLVEYYAPPVPPGRIVYMPRGEAAIHGADWFVAHRLDRHELPPPAVLKGLHGVPFKLARVFPHAGPSGFDWYLYRAVDRPLSPRPGSGPPRGSRGSDSGGGTLKTAR